MNHIFIIIICLIFSAFFSGIETALLSLNLLNTVRGNKEKLYKLYSMRERIIITCLIANNLCVVFATLSLGSLIKGINLSSIIILLIFSIQIIVFFLFTEIIPKAIARKKYTTLLSRGYYYIMASYYIFYPISWLLFSLLKYFLKGKNIDSINKEDVFHFVSSNFIEETPMSKMILQLGNTYTKSIHSAIGSIYCIEKNKKVKDCIELLNCYPYSRYPVYEDNKENIVGYIEVSDLLNYSKNIPLESIMKKPTFVSEFLNVDILLIRMQKKNIPIVFTVNEYGNILGIVTQEDIAEIIVGEIFSYEQKHIQPNIKPIGKSQFLIDALVDIDYFNDYFNKNIQKDMHNTLNGYLLKQTKIFPKKNEIVFTPVGKFKIEEIGTKSIIKVSFVSN